MKTLTSTDITGNDRIEFDGKYISGCVYNDGSGELWLKNNMFFADHGTHKQRVKSFKKEAKIFIEAVKELEKLDLKLKRTKTKKRSV